MSVGRILPKPVVHGIWKYDWDPYPTFVRVVMSDGHVIRYVRDIKQPKPVFGRQLDHFDEICQVEKKPRQKRMDRRKDNGL